MRTNSWTSYGTAIRSRIFSNPIMVVVDLGYTQHHFVTSQFSHPPGRPGNRQLICQFKTWMASYGFEACRIQHFQSFLNKHVVQIWRQRKDSVILPFPFDNTCPFQATLSCMMRSIDTFSCCDYVVHGNILSSGLWTHFSLKYLNEFHIAKRKN